MIDTQLDDLGFHESDAPREIRAKLRAVGHDEANFGVLSTGEQCAVALVLDRPDFAKKGYGSLLDCPIRIGPEWLAAAACAQANGWTEPAELDPA